ncbi:MAG: hypothetical protein KF716_26540 [Anaerolineae bacterium]|nr:hypothetical protein [Anaerolineae bacterium]
MQDQGKSVAFSGQPLADYHMAGKARERLVVRLLRLLIGGLVLVAALGIAYLPLAAHTPFSDAWILYVSSGAFLIAALLIIGVRFTPPADSVQIAVYPEGIKGRSGRPFQVAWREIAYLWGEITSEESNGSPRGQSAKVKITTKCTIQLIDGRSIAFGGEQIEKAAQSGHTNNKAAHTIELIEAKFNEAMLPTFIERFERGETIKFPPDFAINKDGINYRNREFLEWPQFAYASPDLERGVFQLRQTDRRRQSVQDWMVVPTHSIANVTLFQAMLKRMTQPISGYDWS